MFELKAQPGRNNTRIGLFTFKIGALRRVPLSEDIKYIRYRYRPYIRALQFENVPCHCRILKACNFERKTCFLHSPD